MKDSPQPALQTGDLVFIRIPAFLFRKVADASASWTNHVGIVVGQENGEWMVAESCVPLARQCTFAAFVGRSENGRYCLRRLPAPLDADQQARLRQAAAKRLGTLYHTGFALHSRRQFCSKFVYEVLREACGITVGRIETFATLLSRNPQTSIGFWRLWFFGRIPWQRETITPASQLACPQLQTVFAA